MLLGDAGTPYGAQAVFLPISFSSSRPNAGLKMLSLNCLCARRGCVREQAALPRVAQTINVSIPTQMRPEEVASHVGNVSVGQLQGWCRSLRAL